MPISDVRRIPAQWKAIPGYPKYEVSDQGQVRTYWPWRNFRNVPRLLTPVLESNGHLSVKLTNGPGTAKTFLIARLVLMAFDRLPQTGEQALHKDDPNPANNFLSNLYWGSASQNVGGDYVRQHGRHYNSKITDPTVRAIRGLRASGLKLRVIAKRFGICESSVSGIATGKTHRYVE